MLQALRRSDEVRTPTCAKKHTENGPAALLGTRKFHSIDASSVEDIMVNGAEYGWAIQLSTAPVQFLVQYILSTRMTQGNFSSKTSWTNNNNKNKKHKKFKNLWFQKPYKGFVGVCIPTTESVQGRSYGSPRMKLLLGMGGIFFYSNRVLGWTKVHGMLWCLVMLEMPSDSTDSLAL